MRLEGLEGPGGPRSLPGAGGSKRPFAGGMQETLTAHPGDRGRYVTTHALDHPVDVLRTNLLLHRQITTELNLRRRQCPCCVQFSKTGSLVQARRLEEALPSR